MYTLGLNKTMLIVGLGNVGQEYIGTRHNTGFMCLDSFAEAQDMPEWVQKKDMKCLITVGNIINTRIIMMKPTTMMNLSGEAVQAVAAFYKLQAADTYIVYDELDIDFGTIRCRMGGGAAGHNGIKSVIQHVGPDFGRIRIGVGPKHPPQIDSADYVLQRFDKDQSTHIKDMEREVSALLMETVASGELPHESRQFMLSD